MCTKSLFPHYFQGRLEDWLSLLRLEEYTTSLKQQKYVSVEQMTQLTWEDLEDIGITKLGHQKKVHYTILISFIQSFYFLSEGFLILIEECKLYQCLAWTVSCLVNQKVLLAD